MTSHEAAADATFRPSTPAAAVTAAVTAAAAAAERGRADGRLTKDLRAIEATLMAAIDARADSDTDAARKGVIRKALRDASRHRDRYCDRGEFARAIGKFSLGAAPRAGYAGRMHWVMRQPLQPSADVSPAVIDALFERYAEDVFARDDGSGEPLIDADSFYGRLKRSVKPPTKPPREQTGLQWHASRMERELREHPASHASRGGPLHPYGQHPVQEQLTLRAPP